MADDVLHLEDAELGLIFVHLKLVVFASACFLHSLSISIKSHRITFLPEPINSEASFVKFFSGGWRRFGEMTPPCVDGDTLQRDAGRSSDDKVLHFL